MFIVSKLTSSILSLRLLDEDGCKSVQRREFMSVFDRFGKLLARARKTKKATDVFDSATVKASQGERSARGGANVEPA